MSLMTSPAALQFRTALRQSGFSNVIMNLLRMGGYERALTRSMKNAVMPGDVVWDVGANIGEYALLFSEWTGPTGRVFAFEPDAQTGARLTATLASAGNVTVVPMGLSDHEGSARFIRDEHPDGATFKVAGPDEEANAVITLTTGAAFVRDNPGTAPDVVKIDIEGHELEALLGLTPLLGDVRDIFIEIHFFILSARGQDKTPSQIEQILKDKGHMVTWVDQSHIHARHRIH